MLRAAATVLCLALSAFCTVGAAEPPIPVEERARMLATFREQVVTLTQAIAQSPREVSLYSRRGDRRLFLGEFAAAVADFERMIALDPAQDAPHWRLGIAYYFNGQFAPSARQFEKYHAHDSGDRENGLWKFLGDVPALGIDGARRALLVYTRFDREPFPALYALFAGKTTPAVFFSGLRDRGLDVDARVLFFANYYAGLHEWVHGRPEAARPLLHAAVANLWGRTAEGGPAYMWQVARLHYESLPAPGP